MCGTPHISEPGGSLCQLRQKRRAEGLPPVTAINTQWDRQGKAPFQLSAQAAREQAQAAREQAQAEREQTAAEGAAERARLSRPVDGCVCGYHNASFTYDQHLTLVAMAEGARVSDKNSERGRRSRRCRLGQDRRPQEG